MKRLIPVVMASLFWTTSLAADGIRIGGAFVPLAPPGVMSHAAYLTLENTSDRQRSLIGVRAEGYGMAHLHKSEDNDGVATMSMVHQLDIAPGQTVSMRPGGLHIMLMRPKAALAIDGTVSLTLMFANGEEVQVKAAIKARGTGS